MASMTRGYENGRTDASVEPMIHHVSMASLYGAETADRTGGACRSGLRMSQQEDPFEVFDRCLVQEI